MKLLVMWGVALVAGYAGVLAYPYLPELPKAGVAPAYQPPTATASSCEDQATLETLKRLATNKIREGSSVGGDYYLLKQQFDYNIRVQILLASISGDLDFTLSGFRERGKIGNGFLCAAFVSARAHGKTGSAEMSTEYSVEPTTDGKIIVSARFMPN